MKHAHTKKCFFKSGEGLMQDKKGKKRLKDLKKKVKLADLGKLSTVGKPNF